MSTRAFVTCDCCHREINMRSESWLVLTLQPNQYDNRAFVHLDGKTFTNDESGSYCSGSNGIRFDVCQTCAPRFGVVNVTGNPEYAREELEKANEKREPFISQDDEGKT